MTDRNSSSKRVNTQAVLAERMKAARDRRAITAEFCSDILQGLSAHETKAHLSPTVESAAHEGAPSGCRCADCTISGEACPHCFTVWWQKRHPHMHQVGSAVEPTEITPNECQNLRCRATGKCVGTRPCTLVKPPVPPMRSQEDCPQVGNGGRHSESYYDDGACSYCGAKETKCDHPPDAVMTTAYPGVFMCRKCKALIQQDRAKE
jgi:hypothetical protein